MPHIPVYAAGDTTSFAGGSGTATDPYLIETKEHLNNVRNNLSAHYKMIADVIFTDDDFSEGGSFYNSGSGFLPIGTASNNVFTGTFDGNGYVVKNIHINVFSTNTAAYAGLFGYNQGTIKGLGIVEGIIAVSNSYDYVSDSYSGSIVGYNNGGTVKECYSSASVTATCTSDYSYVNPTTAAGGIVGYNRNGIIENCYNTGSASAFIYSKYYNYAGGIVGRNISGTITGCYNAGVVSGNYTGGITAQNYDGGSIVNCYNIGTVTARSNSTNSAGGIVALNNASYKDLADCPVKNCFNSGIVSAESEAGGIVGTHSKGTIESCYNTGEVTASTAGGIVGTNDDTTTKCYNTGSVSGKCAGGIVGSNDLGAETVNCYNTGTISATVSSRAGGIVGYNNYDGVIQNCYNIGIVLGDAPGGIAGYNYDSSFMTGKIKNCYYLDTISQGVGKGSDTATKSSAAALQGKDTFNKWDFDSIWEYKDKNLYRYPTLIENPYWDGEFAGGTGTELDPYLIKTKKHLNNVRNYLDAHYKMVADIVFSDEDFSEGGSFYNSGSGFIPIGSKDEAFCGSFDGNGYSISNLLIYISSTSGDAYAGLFAINNGVVKNLGIENGNISVYPDSNQYAYCGSIAGKNLGTISDCYSTGSVWSRRYAGGITGYNSGTITDCYNNGAITASKDFDLSAGGIVGYNYDGIISNCYNNGQISSCTNVVSTFMTTYYAFAGGIVGYGYDGTVEKCYNTGSINATSNVIITENSDAYASANSGGIIGSNRSCSIVQCYNIGAISADTTADGHWYDTAKSYAGGIAGSNASGVGSCYNVGSITTTSSTGHNYPGGIAGNNSGSISTSYNVANAVENIASNNSGTIKNCYFHSETLSAGCKLASLFSVLTYQGFNFDSVWQMSDGDYPLPVLRSVKNYASFEYSPAENTVDFASGKGTEADPFIIKTITHLDNIRKYPSSYFVLANDITFEPENEAFVAGWKPFAFKGYLDGKDYKITGIRITVSNTLEYQWRDPGLFSSNDGTIKNITVEDMRISVSNMGDEYGGFICAVNNGEIINCHSKGCTISLQNIYHFFGGIAGNNSGSIKNCTSNNTFNWGANGGRIGGIAANNTGSIIGCTNNSTITNIGSYTPISGGIAAQNSGDIIGSNNLASILTRSTYSQRNGYSGGIVGQMTGGQISQCYNLGAISTEATEYKANTYSGGIVAYISDGNILDCYNTGDIYGEPNSSSASCYVGGIVGYNNSIGTLENCYSIGGNSGRASSANLYVGYICGYNASNTIENCYYLGVVNNGSGSGDCSTMYGKNVAALKSQDTYAGFNFTNIWTTSGNSDYPFPELVAISMEYEKEVKSIQMDTMPTKLTYIENYEPLSVAGGTIKVTYKYDEYDVISLSDATVSGFDNSVVGRQSITVSYLGYTTEFEVEILKKSLDRIEVTTLPDKTTYYMGETLSTEGLVVTAYYNDNTSEAVINYSVSGAASILGINAITVEWQGKTCSFDITVTCVPGDIDGDKVVTQDDAVYLLLNTMFGEAFYPLNNAPGDIDNNGTVNQDDAVYLLLHSMFGEMFYPLNTAALPVKAKE
ncbi:MAG: bacterial Ig-like domain-containing protein [Bacteroidaceae bacterium]|nr:bacterial Ig-like domain-containing protein [Bacteroidaceae bacterium]